jgi:hypothetical protein
MTETLSLDPQFIRLSACKLVAKIGNVITADEMLEQAELLAEYITHGVAEVEPVTPVSEHEPPSL